MLTCFNMNKNKVFPTGMELEGGDPVVSNFSKCATFD